MNQLAAREGIAAANRAYVRDKIAERGWAAEIEAEGRRLFAAIVQQAIHEEAAQPRTWGTWVALYFRAYEDGAKRRLSGHRLDHYAHAYADVVEPQGVPTIECFWLGWEAGVYEADEVGTWHERVDLVA